jgi:hypothetical protein
MSEASHHRAGLRTRSRGRRRGGMRYASKAVWLLPAKAGKNEVRR